MTGCSSSGRTRRRASRPTSLPSAARGLRPKLKNSASARATEGAPADRARKCLILPKRVLTPAGLATTAQREWYRLMPVSLRLRSPALQPWCLTGATCCPASRASQPIAKRCRPRIDRSVASPEFVGCACPATARAHADASLPQGLDRAGLNRSLPSAASTQHRIRNPQVHSRPCAIRRMGGCVPS
jgi:hypothetical protein